MTPERRTLRFTHFDEVMPEVERLLRGHVAVGSWLLSQICQHLAASLRLAADMPATLQHDPSLRFSQEKIDEVFASERLPEGLPRPATAPAFEPLPESEAAERLRDALAYYKASAGPVAAHRYLGPLTQTPMGPCATHPLCPSPEFRDPNDLKPMSGH